MPANKYLFPSHVIEQMRREAKHLVKLEGIPYHQALDRVARDDKLGIRDWHHVIEEAKATAPSEQAFRHGFVVGLDPKDADFNHARLRYFVPDDRIFGFVLDEYDDQNPEPRDDDEEGMREELSDLIFFRSKEIIPTDDRAARVLCEEDFFFVPMYGRLRGRELPFFLDIVEDDEEDGYV